MVEDSHELGLAAYREGRFYEAHEHWEELWLATREPERRLVLQALVQLAAALHKVQSRERVRGAPVLLARAAEKLARVRSEALGIDAPALRDAIVALREEVLRWIEEGARDPLAIEPPVLRAPGA